MPSAVQGKTILVTGANRGIGKAIVEAFVEGGAALVYAGVRTLASGRPLVEATRNSKKETKVQLLQMDYSRPETIVEALRDVDQLDIVVNNAGVLTNHAPLDTDVFAGLQSELTVNVYGMLHVAQACQELLKQSTLSPCFVQINSVGSLRPAAPHVASYSASKAAAYSLTLSLRMQWKEDNIRVLSVHPGPIQTDMIKQAKLANIAEPPLVVANALMAALADDSIVHVFPDTKAQGLGAAYQSFAETVIEPCIPYPE